MDSTEDLVRNDNVLTWDDIQKAMEMLNEAESSWSAIIHPSIWNGYWYVHERSHFLRWLGRKLHSKRIYAIGLQVEWVIGMKDWPEVQDEISNSHLS